MNTPTPKAHWTVENITYPLPVENTVTEFKFSNGCILHYDPEVGDLTMFLPAREAIESTVGQTQVLHEEQFKLSVQNAPNGVPVIVNVTKRPQ